MLTMNLLSLWQKTKHEEQTKAAKNDNFDGKFDGHFRSKENVAKIFLNTNFQTTKTYHFSKI